MIIALHSHRARQRVATYLQREIDWAFDFGRGPRAGYAQVSEAEFAQVSHLPGVRRSHKWPDSTPRPPAEQLALL